MRTIRIAKSVIIMIALSIKSYAMDVETTANLYEHRGQVSVSPGIL